jgi:hypothetical protein
MFYHDSYRYVSSCTIFNSVVRKGASWWSFGSWIYNYLCNQYLSPLTLQVRIRTRLETFNFQQISVGVSFIGGVRKRWSTEKTTDLPQVTGKLYHIMLYRLGEIRTCNVSGDKYWLLLIFETYFLFLIFVSIFCLSHTRKNLFRFSSSPFPLFTIKFTIFYFQSIHFQNLINSSLGYQYTK